MLRHPLSTAILLGLAVLLVVPSSLVAAPPQTGTVNVTANFCNATDVPPLITSPPDNSVTLVPNLTLEGTGNPSEVITVFRNGYNAGSTTTDSTGQWTLTISLLPGANTISAVNCPGQATITVTYNAPPPPTPGATPAPPTRPPDQTVPPGQPGQPNPPQPNSPAIVPRGVLPPSAATGRQAPTPRQPLPYGSFILTTIQSVTELNLGDPVTLDFVIEGGSSSFQITVIWEDGTTDRATTTSNGSVAVTHRFRKAGSHHVTVKVRDRTGREALISYVVKVNGPDVLTTTTKHHSLWMLFLMLSGEFLVVTLLFIAWEYYHRRREAEEDLLDEA